MIDSYESGRLVVKGTSYTRDVIVYPDRVDDAWARADEDQVCAADLAEVFAANPEVVIIGKGDDGSMEIAKDVTDAARERGIEVIARSTPYAVTLYNEAATKQRAIACLRVGG